MKNLEARINILEQRLNDKHFIPGLVYFSADETEDQARARYKAEHGFDFPADMRVICISVVDASRKSA